MLSTIDQASTRTVDLWVMSYSRSVAPSVVVSGQWLTVALSSTSPSYRVPTSNYSMSLYPWTFRGHRFAVASPALQQMGQIRLYVGRGRTRCDRVAEKRHRARRHGVRVYGLSPRSARPLCIGRPGSRRGPHADRRCRAGARIAAPGDGRATGHRGRLWHAPGRTAVYDLHP